MISGAVTRALTRADPPIQSRSDAITSPSQTHEIVMSSPDAISLQRLPTSIRENFEELSMDGVLSHVSPGVNPLPEDMEPLQQTDLDAAQQGTRMLSAHETLASLSPENREVFKGVVESLRADLDPND